jgi:catechol-2,3-dioxygenase
MRKVLRYIKGEHSMTDKPVTPRGINHLVLNVRNLEDSHKFWTEVVGMQQVGELKPAPNRPNPPRMRFYSGAGSAGTHHDLALVENPNLPEPPVEWSMVGMPMAINHIAITYPNREAWLQQLSYLQAKGVKFDRRVEHGMTHSLYIHDPNGYGVELLYDLPREIWERDIDAALNFAVAVPTEGAEALVDRTADLPVFGATATVAE